MTPLELQDKLARFLEARLGAPVKVRNLERNTEGFSQETFSFDAALAGETRRYVAKREPVAGLLEPYDLEPEFRVLHGLSGQGVLSPPTPWFSDDRAAGAPFYVMGGCRASAAAHRGATGTGPCTPAEREALAEQWPPRSRACTRSTGKNLASFPRRSQPGGVPPSAS